MHKCCFVKGGNVHLVVEDLGFARLGVGDEALIQNIKDVLADLLKFGLNLLAVLLDDGNVLLRALALFLLLDGGDDAPRGTAGADHVLVSDAEEVALIDGELAAELGDLLHVRDHFIVALCLLAKAGEESLAVGGCSPEGSANACPGHLGGVNKAPKSGRANLSRCGEGKGRVSKRFNQHQSIV